MSTWVNRFIKNCYHSKLPGPLTTSVIEKQRKFYINGEQKRLQSSEKFQQDRKYGSPNVAILSELNIYSLDKIYGQCENLIFTICK